MQKQIKLYILLWLLYFLIAIGFGYPSLRWFSPASTLHLDDAAIYSDIVQRGVGGMSEDHRSTRVLVPFIAKFFYHFVNGKTGSWDPVQLSMLVVAAIFCASVVVCIMFLSINMFSSPLLGLVASFIFVSNFNVTNLYLAGLVDSAECFFVLLFLISMHTNRWLYLPVITLFGTLAKESFLPISLALAGVWWMYEAYFDKKMCMRCLFLIVMSAVVGFVMIVLLKSFIFEDITMPWNFAKSIESSYEMTFDRLIVELRHFSYGFIWLLPLALLQISAMPKKWNASILAGVFVLLLLGWWAGVSGAAMSRYMFNLTGPFLSIAAASFLVKYIQKAIR